VVFYGLVTREVQSVVDFYLTREEAEATLRDVLADEPDWQETVGLVRLDFSCAEPLIKRLN
jgi:hypothetical protein